MDCVGDRGTGAADAKGVLGSIKLVIHMRAKVRRGYQYEKKCMDYYDHGCYDLLCGRRNFLSYFQI